MMDIIFQILMAPFVILTKITDFILPSASQSNRKQSQSRRPNNKEEVYWPPYF